MNTHEKEVNDKLNFLNNEILSSSFSRESSLYEVQDKLKKGKTSYDEFELDSKQELVFHSIGTGSDHSYFHETNEEKIKKYNGRASKKSSSNRSNNKSDMVSNKTLKNSEYALITKNEKTSQKVNDETVRGNRSTTYNPQMADSLSTLSDKKKKIIVRVVTVFSIVFFLICFAMIAFTLRMSEKIDAQIRKGYSGYNFNTLSMSTKSIHPQLITQNLDKKNSKIIQKLKTPDSFTPSLSVITSTLLLQTKLNNPMIFNPTTNLQTDIK